MLKCQQSNGNWERMPPTELNKKQTISHMCIDYRFYFNSNSVSQLVEFYDFFITGFGWTFFLNLCLIKISFENCEMNAILFKLWKVKSGWSFYIKLYWLLFLVIIILVSRNENDSDWYIQIRKYLIEAGKKMLPVSMLKYVSWRQENYSNKTFYCDSFICCRFLIENEYFGIQSVATFPKT